MTHFLKDITKLLFLFSAFILISTVSIGQDNSVAIGSASTKANAVLWLNGDGSQGLLLPSVSSTGSVSTPDAGMVVFQTLDNKIHYFNGSIWVAIGSGGSGGGDSYSLNLNGSSLELLINSSVQDQIELTNLTVAGEITGTIGATVIGDGVVGITKLGSMGLGTGDTGKILQWNGTGWETAANSGASGITYTSGNGISIDGSNVISVDETQLTDALVDNETITSAVLNGTSLDITEAGNLTQVDLSSLAGAGSGDLVSTNNLSDVTDPAIARTNLGLGTVATLNTITTTEITDGTITDADIAGVGVAKITGLLDNDASNEIQTAAQVSVTPQNGVASNNTQAALEELQSEIATNTSAIAALPVGGDMTKLVYDNNNDNLVDDSEMLGGQLPAVYLDNTDAQTALMVPYNNAVSSLTATNVKAAIDEVAAKSLPTMSAGQIIVANGGGTPTAVTMGTDATIAAGGVLTIANNAISGGAGGKITDGTITNDDISGSAGIGVTKIAAPGGTDKGILVTSGTVNSWLTTATGNRVFGTDLTNNLTARPVILSTGAAIDNSGIRVAGTASDVNLVSEAAVRQAIDAAGGSLQSAYDGGKTIQLDGTAISVTNSGTNQILNLDNNGTLRVGTSAQANINGVKLQVSDLNASTAPMFHIQNQGAGDAALRFWQGAGPVYTYAVGVDGSDVGKFKISNFNEVGTNDRLVIDLNGNIGIGTNAPVSQLQIGSATHTLGETGFSGLSYNLHNNAGFKHTIADGASVVALQSGYAGLFTYGNAGANASASLANRLVLTTTGASVNKDGPDPSAVFHVVSGTVAGGGTPRGFLMPTMIASDRDAIPTPATGLMVYNTSANEFNYYDGGAWTGFGATPTLQGAYDGGPGISMATTTDINIETSSAFPVFNIVEATGSVGIGTTIPAGRFEVSTPNGAALKVVDTDVYIGDYEGNQFGTYMYIDPEANSNFQFMNGNVGIGVTAPAEKLDVNGHINMANGFALKSNSTSLLYRSGTTTVLNTGSGENLSIAQAGASRIYVNTAGNVGIGTNTPSSTLDVVGNIELSGEVNRTATGAANMIPIAYGYVSATGVLSANSGNVSVLKSGTGVYYITIAGESYFYSSYITTATKINIGFITTNSVSNNLIINTFDIAGTPADAAFSFIVHKP